MRLARSLIAAAFAPLVLAGCQTTETSSRPARAPVPLTAETQELVLGYWEGRWEADNGSGNAFSLDLSEIAPDGAVRGRRAFVTESYGSSALTTVGEIRDGELHLDVEKGPRSWIVLALARDEQSGELWLQGRYSAQGGDNVFLGDVSARKWKDL